MDVDGSRLEDAVQMRCRCGADAVERRCVRVTAEIARDAGRACALPPLIGLAAAAPARLGGCPPPSMASACRSVQELPRLPLPAEAKAEGHTLRRASWGRREPPSGSASTGRSDPSLQAGLMERRQ